MVARLLPDPDSRLVAALDALPEALRRVMPLKGRHRRQLPRQVAELSSMLTVARDELPGDYMNRPALLAAYLNHFLPWNLLRQGRLLQGLGAELGLGPGATVLDVGSGPLTFALALWLARPDLKAAPLGITALDRSEPALKTGRALLEDLAPDMPWTVRTRRTGGRQGSRPSAPVDLLTAANVLNEMDAAVERRRGGRKMGREREGMEERLLADWGRLVRPRGRVLLIEPGTRAGGRMIAAFREHALRAGWEVVLPCPHAGECPQPGTGRRPWCHFAVTPAGAPAWLLDLDRAAGLPKQRLSLSFLLLRTPGDQPEKEKRSGQGAMPARVMSDVMVMDDGRRACYGCSGRGLLLIETAPREAPRQGDLVTVRIPGHPVRDRKSGALIVPRRKS